MDMFFVVLDLRGSVTRKVAVNFATPTKRARKTVPAPPPPLPPLTHCLSGWQS